MNRMPVRDLATVMALWILWWGDACQPAFAQSTPRSRFGHVEKVGRGPRALVLIPCLGCDWRSYDELMARNASRFTMYAITWPGMGDTPPPEPLPAGRTPLWDNLNAALLHLITSERLSRPVLVGHSAAAVQAVQFAALHPALVGGVINVDAVITNWDWFGFTPGQRDSAVALEMAQQRGAYDSDEAWERLNRNAAAGIPREDRREHYIAMWLRPARETVFRYWEEWLRVDVGALLPRVTIPVHSVYVPGAGSKHPDHITARFQRNGAPSNFSLRFLPGARHTIWESHPAEFDAILAEFVASLP
jgi:pimeloyl-ACP methyl ester carboxylesterase